MDYEITNPHWVRDGVIDVIWNHPNPEIGTIPYTCINNFGEPEMQTIWDAIQRGDFGPIAGEP